MLELNKIYNMDCLEGLKKLDDNSIDLIVTSPPYDNLRDYKNNFIWNINTFEKIANQLYRIIKKGGVIVWIVNDAIINGSETGSSFKQALYFQKIGFNLHDTMIWQKPNFSMPSKNRYHQIFEYMFIFSKDKPNTFNGIKDRINKYNTCFGKNTVRTKLGKMKELTKNYYGKLGLRFNVWKNNTVGQDFMGKKLSHPAMFPLKLIKDHIFTWSNKNDIVLDPFIGSGTTAVACKELQRNYIGFEISKEYCDIAEQRLEKWKGQKRLF